MPAKLYTGTETGNTLNGSIRLALNGFDVWAYVVELEEGFRIQLSIDDWDAARLMEG